MRKDMDNIGATEPHQARLVEGLVHDGPRIADTAQEAQP
jgi:hypothetical protein